MVSGLIFPETIFLYFFNDLNRALLNAGAAVGTFAVVN